ncbi:MAG: hypothetical protein AAFR65_04075 [Pseudomonadota bacterium]
MEKAMRDEFEVFCLMMTDETTLVGQAFATDHEMKSKCESFLCKEGYSGTACDGFNTASENSVN